MFDLNSNNTELFENNLNKLNFLINEIKLNNKPQIRESESMKKHLEKLIVEKKNDISALKLFEILKNDLVKQQIFDSSYKEILEKIE